jgi:phosphate transport system permease protein
MFGLLALLVVGAAARAGGVAWARLWAAAAGTTLLCAAGLVLALPLGIAAAATTTVFGLRRRRRHHIDRFLSAMASLPSIVYGLVVAQVLLVTGSSGYLAAALALGAMAAPFVYVATREALEAVSPRLREAALALGADRWQYLRQVLLPAALPGILTGTVLTVARVAGETAILLIVAFTIAPQTGDAGVPAALPLDLFAFLSQSSSWKSSAATYLLVLLAIVLALNAVAIYIRAGQRRGR